MAKKIAVIDGNSLMHRAYHAIHTPMVAKDGTPTNAIFGFLQMFCKLIESTNPDAVVCAFDKGKPEHRLAELPQYKAQRPHMDEELRVQFPVIEELLESMNVPVIVYPGWEGDDILGTIAARNEKLGYQTLLVTGDKDACQLVTDLTCIVHTKKGISDVEVLDPSAVMEKYGVTPSQFRDYLGLMGDASDNIPGVPGIGPKTATSMLQKYNDIEGVYDHIDEFKGKQKEKLEENKDLAFLSRQIATIVTDLDFECDLEGLSFPDFNPEHVSDAFGKYSLVSPLTRVLKLSGATPTSQKLSLTLGAFLDPEEWKSHVSDACSRGERIGCAFEKSNQDTIFGMQLDMCFTTSAGNILLSDQDAKEALIFCLQNGTLTSLDAKETLQLVYPPDSSMKAEISRDELYAAQIFDISLAAYALQSTVSSYTYETLAEAYLDSSLPDYESHGEVLALHATLCRILADKLEEALSYDKSETVYNTIDMPLVPVLVQMERIGLPLDIEHLKDIGEEAKQKLSGLASRIYEIAGEEFNIDSPKQLAHILFEVMGIVPIKKNQRGYSTDASVLKELSKTHEIAHLVIEYREISKIKGTYIDSLPNSRGGDKRLHTVFHETVTATGRLSSSDPNLQNIPVRSDFGRQIRTCFVPLEAGDVFLSADYSQIELRLLAHLSQDPHLIEAFNSGTDFHAQTAARVFGKDVTDITPELRSRAKAVNFGIVYGQQAFGLSQTLDIPRKEAQEMIDMYFAAYPKVREFLDSIVEGAKEAGFAETIYGRKRHIPELRSKNKQVYGVGERTAMNHPMQGTAADIIKLAMIDVQKKLNEGNFASQLLLQVHDELDFSVPKIEIESVSALVKEAMEGIVSLSVPLSVDISYGANWAEAH